MRRSAIPGKSALLSHAVYAVLTATVPLSSPILARDPFAFLQERLGADPRAISRIRDNQAWVTVLPSKVNREVAAAGAIRIRVPVEFFVREYRSIEEFKKNPAVLEIGKFGEPPHSSDLRSLTWNHGDIQDVLQCRPGSCDVKLSARMMTGARRELSASPSESRKNSGSRVLGDLIGTYAAEYWNQGNSAMLSYDDRKPSVSSEREFLEILEASIALRETDPALHKYLAEFPHSSTSEIDGFLYWSKEKFGLKPVVSITHAAILKPGQNAVSWGLIASKQIYASHYFEASLGLTFLAPTSDPSAPELLAIYVNRSRSDGLRGWMAGLKRSIVTRQVRGGMRKNLVALRDKLEAKYRSRVVSRVAKPAGVDAPAAR